MAQYISTHKGYLLTRNPIRDEWYITKDGAHIGTRPTEEECRAVINTIVDPNDDPVKHIV